MMIIAPSELAKENVVDTIKMLQENNVLFVALKKRGPKQKNGIKQYNKPFAALIQWPPSFETLEMINVYIKEG